MPAEPSPVCSKWHAEIKCRQRQAAMDLGQMFYDFQLGWIWPAEDRKWPKARRLNADPPAGWLFCPWCGGPLPDAISAAVKLLADDSEGDED